MALLFQAKTARTGFSFPRALLDTAHGPQKKRGVFGIQRGIFRIRHCGGTTLFSSPFLPSQHGFRCGVLFFVREGFEIQGSERVFSKSIIVGHGAITGRIFVVVKKAAAMPRLNKSRLRKSYGAFGASAGVSAPGVAAGCCGAGAV